MHTRTMKEVLVKFVEPESHYSPQTGLELLDSSNSPALAFSVAKTTGAQYRTCSGF